MPKLHSLLAAGPSFVEKRHCMSALRPGGDIQKLPAFEHWFWNFTETRNRIVHDTLEPDMDYELEGSPLAGNIFRVADRVCRELIRVSLSRLGRPNLLMRNSALHIYESLE